ncbi:MAG: hypothetical protein JWQ38_1414 [Flavipsychrobacter sp.]|nr:hypothetical protein [Flavipsychrobacter sp.]
MRRIFTTITALVLFCNAAIAQPILAGGFGTAGMGLLNGTTYSKTGTLGSGGFAFVSASKDGSKFYATSPTFKLYYINVSSSTIVDSTDIRLRNLASSNEPDMLFATTAAALVRINTTTKTVVDSVVLGAPWLPEERPNSKEVWVTDSGKIHVVNYASGLTVTTFNVAPSPYDYAGVRFSPGGTMAFKAAGTSKMIYKIDPVTKAVIASVNCFPVTPGALVVSHDSSKLFVLNGNKVMIYKTSDLSLIDSIINNKASMNIYLHPTRNEVWTVHHFSDSVSVYNENTNALIASFDVSGSPWYLAFATGSGSSAASNISLDANNIILYPNPAFTALTLTGISAGDGVSIYDIAGKKVISWNVTNITTPLHIADLKTGMYMLQVTDKQGSLRSNIPFVKQ